MCAARGSRHWRCALIGGRGDMKATLLLTLVAIGLVGCGSKGKVLGKISKDPVANVLAINAGTAPQRVTLAGTMIEKCPQAGCWFRLDDGTGVIKVDTKAAGFVVSNIPLNTKVMVSGKLVSEGSEGSEQQLEATGVLY